MSNRSGQLDRELTLLASQERQKILDHFITTGTETETIEVSSCQVARLRVDKGSENSPSTEAAKSKLHHVHLPRLSECDIIDYDARTGVVRYHPDERVEALAQFCDDL